MARPQSVRGQPGREVVIGALCLFHSMGHCTAGREANAYHAGTGGFVAGGRSLAGANGIAGNWAHLPLPAPVPYELDGHDCWCGRTGCMETFVSAEGVEQDYFKITENRTSAAAIASAAANSDIVAESTLQVLEDRLGRATSAVVTIVDPDVIVIGGMVGTMERIYSTVPRKWPGYVTARNPLTRLVPAQCGVKAAAAGAALLTQTQE